MDNILYGVSIVIYVTFGVLLRCALGVLEVVQQQMRHVYNRMQFDAFLDSAYNRILTYLQQGGLVVEPSLPERVASPQPTLRSTLVEDNDMDRDFGDHAGFVSGFRAYLNNSRRSSSRVSEGLFRSMCPHGVEHDLVCDRCNDA